MGAQTATSVTRDPEVRNETCTRDRVPSIVNVARCSRRRTLKKLRSILTASDERSALRSGGGTPRAVVARCATRGLGANGRAGDCAALRSGGLSRLPAALLAGVAAGAACSWRALLRCKAEYHACESARRSIAASGAVNTLTRSCCVIMDAMVRRPHHRSNAATLPEYYSVTVLPRPSSNCRAFCKYSAWFAKSKVVTKLRNTPKPIFPPSLRSANAPAEASITFALRL